jgi:hypothetical protein
VPRTPLSRLRAGSGSSNQSQIAPRAVLSQAGAALSWTSERADTLFVCERVRKAAAHERQPQRAERAMYKEGGDMLFVPERRRSRRAPRRDPRSRCPRRRSAGGADETPHRAGPATHSFRRIRRRRRLSGGHRSERSEPLDTASIASGTIKPDRATRRAEEEGGDMLFVPERRRSRRAPRRDPRGASIASGTIKRGSA